MIIGTVRETKIEEYRVAFTPDGAADIVRSGHEVVIEVGAGLGSNYSDDDDRAAGAEVLATAADVYARADLMCEVKEPQPEEFALLRAGQILFTYLHLAAEPEVTDALLPPAASRSVTRRCSATTASCRCSRRCLRSRAAWPSRSGRTT